MDLVCFLYLQRQKNVHEAHLDLQRKKQNKDKLQLFNDWKKKKEEERSPESKLGAGSSVSHSTLNTLGAKKKNKKKSASSLTEILYLGSMVL